MQAFLWIVVVHLLNSHGFVVHNSSLARISPHEFEIAIEGKDYFIEKIDRERSKITVDAEAIKVFIYHEDMPIELNLNLYDKSVLAKGPVVYRIPDDNHAKIVADLNFFDKKRESSRVNKRIVFRKGEIRITKISSGSLVMAFDGEGSGMMEKENGFVIKGRVDASF